MARISPEKYIQLPIFTPDGNQLRVATGPEAWANILVEMALKDGRRSDIPDALRIGSVAIGVFFAANESAAVRNNFKNHGVISGDSKVQGDSLAVGKARRDAEAYKV